MKCVRQPVYLRDKPTPITELWEVHLQERTWEAVRSCAKQRKCSYSNISRYCLFRLIEHQNLKWNRLMSDTKDGLMGQITRGASVHRHVMCFYGEDLRAVRYAAMVLGITVSMLIRIAIQLYLPRLAMENRSRKVSNEELFKLGVKRWQYVQCAALNHFRIPLFRQLTFSSFFPWQWWPRRYAMA